MLYSSFSATPSVPCSQLSCDTIWNSQSCTFQADPDVAGLGVVLAFLIPAWIAYILVIFGYLFVKDGISANHMNRLDGVVIGVVGRCKKSFVRAGRVAVQLLGLLRPDDSEDNGTASEEPIENHSKMSLDVLQQLLINFSDQQLVTGMAILSLAYAKRTSMTQYHFEIVTTLAWLSFSTHQCTFLVLGGLLEGKFAMKTWRVVWILSFTCLLFTAQIVSYNDNFLWSWGTSVQCIFDNINGNYSSLSNVLFMVANMALLVWGALEILYETYPRTFRALGRINLIDVWFFQRPLARLIEVSLKLRTKCSRRRSGSTIFIARFTWRMLAAVATTSAVLLSIVQEVCLSIALSLLRVWAFLFWGTVHVFITKSGASVSGMQGNENSWTFGQAVSLFLLALPLFNMLEICYGAYIGDYSEQETTSSSEENHQQDCQDLNSTSSPHGQDSAIGTSIGTTFDMQAPHNVESLQESLIGQRRSHTAVRRSNESQLRASRSAALLEKRRVSPSPLVRAPSLQAGPITSQSPGCSSPSLDFTNELYENRWFGRLLIIVLSGIFVAITFGALEGFAF